MDSHIWNAFWVQFCLKPFLPMSAQSIVKQCQFGNLSLYRALSVSSRSEVIHFEYFPCISSLTLCYHWMSSVLILLCQFFFFARPLHSKTSKSIKKYLHWRDLNFLYSSYFRNTCKMHLWLFLSHIWWHAARSFFFFRRTSLMLVEMVTSQTENVHGAMSNAGK